MVFHGELLLFGIACLCLVEGIVYMLFPRKIREYALRIAEVKGETLRLLGCGAVLLGVVLLVLFKTLSQG